MGNHITCCRQKWLQLTEDGDEKLSTDDVNTKSCYRNAAAVFSDDLRSSGDFRLCPSNTPVTHPYIRMNSGGYRSVTQHISEREPEDFEFDPSLNASRHALFIMDQKISGFASCLVVSHSNSDHSETCDRRYRSERFLIHKNLSRKWSSCYTVYIGDGWLVNPSLEPTLGSVSIAIELLLRSSINQRLWKQLYSDCTEETVLDHMYPDIYCLFDERKFSLLRYSTDNSGDLATLHRLDFTHIPLATEIHQFIHGLFRTAFLGPQCAIVALIFLERLVNAAEVALLPWSWRRQFLACVLLASKILDDQAVWNTDYRQILQDVSVEDLNALERHTLSLLQFNIDVPLAVYTRYYFDLLVVGEARCVANRLSDRRLLTPHVAKQLHIIPCTSELDRTDLNETYTRCLFGVAFAKEEDVHLRPSARGLGKKLVVKPSKHPTPSMRPTLSIVSAKSKFNRSVSSDGFIKFIDTHRSQCSNVSQGVGVHSTPMSAETDDGPLVVDEETEFVNTMTLPRLQTSSSVDHANAQSHPRTTSGDSHLPSLVQSPQNLSQIPYSPLIHQSVKFKDTSDCITESLLNQVAPSNCIGFMRSVMGGDVAYTLLHDTGMF